MRFSAPIRGIIHNERKFVIALFLFSLLLRLSFVLAIEPKYYFSDSLLYEDAALKILSGQGFGDYKREPLYPLWMAATYFFTGGKSIVALRIVESLLSALLPVLIFLVARNIFNPTVGKIAGIMAAPYPFFVFLSGLNYPTLPGALFITTAAYFLLLLNHRRRWIFSLLAGIMLGLAALTIAPSATLVVAAVFWVLVFSDLARKEKWLHAVVVGSAFVLTLTPWTVRNYSHYHKFVPIRHDGGKHTFQYYTDISDKYLRPQLALRKQSAIKKAARGVAIYLGNFVQFFRISPTRNLVSSDPNYNLNLSAKDNRITRRNSFTTSNLNFLISAITFGPLLVFSILSLFFMRAYFREAMLLAGFVVTLALTYAYFVVRVRYRIPVEPLILILAAYGVYGTWTAIRSRLSSRLA